jgi:gas vesicle protein
MSEFLLPDSMPKEARKQILSDSADHIEEGVKYQKPLSTEMLDIKREQLANNAIRLSELDDALDIIKKNYKDQMDPLKRQNKDLLDEIKTKQETVEGRLYHMANHQTGFMETYDHEGELISTRRLRPDERQSHLFAIAK